MAFPNTETQFTAGKSGNPLGRPPGIKNRSTIAKEFAAMITSGKNLKGEDSSMTAEELMMAALWRKAFDGDINAIKEIQDTLYGKITDRQEIDMQASVTRVERKIIDNASD